MNRPTPRATLINIFLLANVCILTIGLGQYYAQPTQSEFQLISVSQLNSFTANYTATISYNTTKIRQPTPLITYDILLSDHTLKGSSPVYQQWFYIWFANVTKTSIDIFFFTYNQPNVAGQYFSFKVLVSCVDTRYFHIVNWEYMGPRLNGTQYFFDVTINPPPEPFQYCFSDAASTVREKINFLMTFNGVIAANWAILVRNPNLYSRTNFHITNSNVSYFNVSMMSDQLTWGDKFFLGMLFTCPKSYTLKLKYYTEIHFIGVGTPWNCMDETDYTSSYITLANNYPYLEILVFRAIQPMVGVGFTYAANFTLDATVNPLLRYYRAWNICGFVDYLVMHVVEKYCQGNRTYIQANGSCICNNSMNFYDNGSITCNFICPSPLVDIDFECYSCYQLYGLGCVGCSHTTCAACDGNFILANGNLSCECVDDDRFIFNSTACYLCSDVYDPYCVTCDNMSCSACAQNFALLNNKCYCTGGKFVFLGMCLLCETYYGAGCISCNQISCLACGTNWTQNLDRTCACVSPSYIQVATGNCIQVNVSSNNNTNITQTQTFSMSETHIQLGSSLYIYLSFNRPLSEITQIIPLQANTIFTQGQSQITSVNWRDNGLSIVVNLNSLSPSSSSTTTNPTINNSELTIQIINPKYLLWNQISLHNQLAPITTQPFLSQSTTQMAILQYLCAAVQWLYPLMILGSWGVFNNGFQLWFLLTYYVYLKPNIYGHTETVLAEISTTQFLPFFNTLVSTVNITHDNINLTEIATSHNTSILQMTLPVIVVYLTSIVMCLAVRYYVQKKRNNQMYTVYYNFMRYYKEYVYSNFLAVYAFIVLPIGVQFQAMFKSGWDVQGEDVFVNMIISAVIVVVIVITPFLTPCIFPINKPYQQPQQQQAYSVVYNKLQPTGMFVLIENYLRVFRAPVFILMIFLLRDNFVLIAEAVLIAYTVGYLLVVAMNLRKYISKLYWVFYVGKNVVFVGFQVGFLFLPRDYSASSSAKQQLTSPSSSTIIVDTVCSWVVIALIVFEITQLLVKIVRMFLANKYDWNQFKVPSTRILPITEMGDVLFSGDGNFDFQRHQLQISMNMTATRR